MAERIQRYYGMTLGYDFIVRDTFDDGTTKDISTRYQRIAPDLVRRRLHAEVVGVRSAGGWVLRRIHVEQDEDAEASLNILLNAWRNDLKGDLAG